MFTTAEEGTGRTEPLSNFRWKKIAKNLRYAPPPLNHLDIKQKMYHVRVFVMTEVICGKYHELKNSPPKIPGITKPALPRTQ
jgi:hypothetical protein